MPFGVARNGRRSTNLRTRKIPKLGRIVVAALGRDDVQVVATRLGQFTGLPESGFRRPSPMQQFTMPAHAFNSEAHLSFSFSFSFSGRRLEP